jgi:hypothetical protein
MIRMCGAIPHSDALTEFGNRDRTMKKIEAIFRKSNLTDLTVRIRTGETSGCLHPVSA